MEMASTVWDAHARLAELAARQYGALGYRQLSGCGVSDGQLRHLMSRGTVTRVGPAKKAATKQPADAAARPKAPAQAPAKKAPAKKAAPPRQPAAKIDDAYRPPPKAAAREEPGQPSARQ